MMNMRAMKRHDRGATMKFDDGPRSAGRLHGGDHFPILNVECRCIAEPLLADKLAKSTVTNRAAKKSA